MVGVTGPLVQGTRQLRGSVKSVTVFALGAVAGAAATGALIGLLGALVDGRLPTIAVGASGCVLLLADLVFRTPTLRRQTCSTWYRERGARSVWALWGFDLGLGFSTIRLSSLYWLMVLFVAALVSPVLAPLVLAFYGFGARRRVRGRGRRPGVELTVRHRLARAGPPPRGQSGQARLGRVPGRGLDPVDRLGSGRVISPEEPVCVVTRITFAKWRRVPGALRRFWRLQRLGRKTIPGLVDAHVRVGRGATVTIVSLWQDELALIRFTTLEAHVQVVRWTIRHKGGVVGDLPARGDVVDEQAVDRNDPALGAARANSLAERRALGHAPAYQQVPVLYGGGCEA